VSAALGVEIESGPIERVPADVSAVGIFQGDRPLRGGAGRTDWRLCGRLSQLRAAGELSGRWGEAVLVQTFGGLGAPLVVALGLGEQAGFGLREQAAAARAAVGRALGLGARSLALPLGWGHEGRVEDLLRATLDGAARALADRPAALLLRLAVPADLAGAAREILTRLATEPLPGPVTLQLPPSRSVTRSPGPRQGVRTPHPLAPPAVK
jgi:hypothetical protein